MAEDKYAIFDALNPFFEIVQKGLTGLVDGKHFFDTIADDAFFDFRYNFPGWPLTIRGRADLMDQYSGYGDTIRLHSADGLVVHHSQDSRVVILEYDVHGKILSTGVSYDNRLHLGHHDREQKNCALERLHGLSCRLDVVERQLSVSHSLTLINPIREAQPTRLLRIGPRPRFVHLLSVGRDPIYQALHRVEQAFSGNHILESTVDLYFDEPQVATPGRDTDGYRFGD